MLDAYFDESGISQSEKLTVVSGFIATDQTWLDFDALWRNALKHELKELSIDWFHMVDCEHGEGAFARWGAKPELRRFAARTMAEAIVKSGLTGFWVSVDRVDWGQIADPKFLAQYPSPYHFCFEDTLSQVSAWVAEFAPGEPVDLIFAEQKEYQGRAEAIFNTYIRAKQTHPLNSLRFAPMPGCAPLQAADLAVYSTNKSMAASLYGRDTLHRVYQFALDVLNDNPASFTGCHYDALSLMQAVESVALRERSS